MLLLALILAGICLLFLATRSEGNQVKVTVQGKMTVYDISENQKIPIDQNGHRTNVLVIKDGEVYMEWADCPDQICVKHKAIKRDGESIICLPQEVYVEMLGGEERGYDN